MDSKWRLNEALPSAFLSYAQADHQRAEALEDGLRVRSVSTWRDKTNLHAGAKWPKVLGEAIQRTSALVLLWSTAASKSEFVELEWNIALALKKPILPVLLDETPLPASLCAMQGIKELEGIADRVTVALQAIEHTQPESTLRQRTIIGQLDKLPSENLHGALKAVKILLEQPGWAVNGPVYQAGGDIHIHGGESNTKALAGHWKVWVGIVVGMLIAMMLVKQLPFDISQQAVVLTDYSTTPAKSTSSIPHISGIVTDESDPPIPIQGANVVVMGSSDTTVTGPEGGFTLPVHGSDDLVRLKITANDFQPVNEYYPIRRNIHVVLHKK